MKLELGHTSNLLVAIADGLINDLKMLHHFNKLPLKPNKAKMSAFVLHLVIVQSNLLLGRKHVTLQFGTERISLFHQLLFGCL